MPQLGEIEIKRENVGQLNELIIKYLLDGNYVVYGNKDDPNIATFLSKTTRFFNKSAYARYAIIFGYETTFTPYLGGFSIYLFHKDYFKRLVKQYER